MNTAGAEAKSEETGEAQAEGGESSSVENKDDGPAVIIKKMDADNDLVREKRLEFFSKKHESPKGMFRTNVNIIDL